MPSTNEQQQQEQSVVDEDWEEWDGSSPFWIHCAAGSFAGVVEHTAVYPLDTVRTHIQVCAACVHRAKHGNAFLTNAAAPHNAHAPVARAAAALRAGVRKPGPSSAAGAASGGGGVRALPTGMWQTMRFLMNEPALALATPSSQQAMAAATTAAAAPQQQQQQQLLQELRGLSRLWRGVQTVLIGCIPAHALYFSSYELVKSATSLRDASTGGAVVPTWWGSSLAGAAAVLGHDAVMTPLDTIKQRMQLGHYTHGTVRAVAEIIQTEGYRALYRSLPITLATNIPYGMVMVSVHETCKQALASPDRPSWQTVFWASSAGGFTAAALTTPLDRIKTALQTQSLAPACLAVRQQQQQSMVAATTCPKHVQQQQLAATAKAMVQHDNWQQAAKFIYRTEGVRGFWRGLMPRVLSHTPAVAISWTTYEMTKQALLEQYHS